MKCPRCNGEGGGMALVEYVDERRSGLEWVRCLNCDGVGQLCESLIEWVERGKALRAARRAAGMNLKEAAEHLGTNIVTLSRMEGGSLEPVEWRPLREGEHG